MSHSSAWTTDVSRIYTSSYITLPPTLKLTFAWKVSSKKALFTANTSIGGPTFTTENREAILLIITDKGLQNFATT